MTVADSTTASLDRRWFLKAGVAVGGGLMVGVQWTGQSRAQPAGPAGFAPNAFVTIHPDGVVVALPKSEMGQGVYTAISMMIAEELDVDLAQVKVDLPPPDPRYAVGTFGQLTGGSTSVRTTWLPMRAAGAAARAMIVAAAARQWKAAPESCSTAHGVVTHAATGRTLAYGQLVDAAARLPVPAAAPLKDPATFRLIGASPRRLDSPGKVNGAAEYGIDVRLPGMVYATVAASPVFGGALRSVDDGAATQVKGFRQVVRLHNAVAVVGDHMWAAKQGLAALKIAWDEGPHAGLQQADVVADLAAAAKDKPGFTARKVGDPQAALARAARRLEAVYQTPFLAHAPMEPMNCTVHVRADGCDIWIGTQDPNSVRMSAAGVLGLPPGKVFVHNHLLGGGFGRRAETDMSVQAVMIGKQVDGPVKLVWTREEDIQHDFYHPHYYDRLEAGLDADGKPVAWTHRLAGSSVFARVLAALPEAMRPPMPPGMDPGAVDSAAETPYAFPNQQMDFIRQESATPTGFWRGVGPTHNVFVVESFMDELAAAAGKDPVAYRRALIGNPRTLGVLELAADKAGWGKPAPAGHGRGVSVFNAFGSYLATVAEVSVKDGHVRVHRVVCAIDCGIPIDPGNIEAQLQSGVIFGMTAAMWGEITIANGRVQQSNFHNYRALRIDESPVIDVYVTPSAEAPGGVGETGTAAIAPAIANAVFAATGKRIRQLPIAKFDFSAV